MVVGHDVVIVAVLLDDDTGPKRARAVGRGVSTVEVLAVVGGRVRVHVDGHDGVDILRGDRLGRRGLVIAGDGDRAVAAAHRAGLHAVEQRGPRPEHHDEGDDNHCADSAAADRLQHAVVTRMRLLFLLVLLVFRAVRLGACLMRRIAGIVLLGIRWNRSSVVRVAHGGPFLVGVLSLVC